MPIGQEGRLPRALLCKHISAKKRHRPSDQSPRELAQPDVRVVDVAKECNLQACVRHIKFATFAN